jgi:hypothetical protein
MGVAMSMGMCLGLLVRVDMGEFVREGVGEKMGI